jgi:two-component system sensor histidine kinase KdpD
VARGELRIYLGAAPGVGKTYAMLGEARRRAERGADVVIGQVETHGRAPTAAMAGGLETVGLDAVLARRPGVAVIDELARHHQLAEVLLESGITVLATVNVEELESLSDVAARITGVGPGATVPDTLVGAAEVELVDMTPEALRRRMAHGNVYPPERIDAALARRFRVENLAALRELALRWLADRAADEPGAGTARERVVVALDGGPEGETLLRRAARLATHHGSTDLLAVHVTREGSDPAALARLRVLVESLGGTYHLVSGPDVPGALLEFARGVNATQIVLGRMQRRVVAGAGRIDVHLVTPERPAADRRRERRPAALSRGRRIAGTVVALVALPLLTVVLLALPDPPLINDILLFLVVVVGVALIGGRWPAVFTAIAGSLLLNWFFTPPYGRFAIAQGHNMLALVIFVLVAVAVSWVVDTAARTTRQAAEASAQAQTLATVAGGVLRGERPLPALLERLRETFGLDTVALVESGTTVAEVGRPGLRAETADVTVHADQKLTVLLSGRTLEASDRRVVEAFAAQAAIALRQERLTAEAATARPLAEANRLRTALLAAVSHDLRTPLASAKASVASLRSPDVTFTEEDRAELLATADESLDKLDRLVANLLDMGRLQAGVLGVAAVDVGAEEVVPPALDYLGPPGRAVIVRVPDDLPMVHADPGLLERVLVNVIGNALRHSPPGRPPMVTGSSHGDVVELRVIDHGPGIPADRWEDVFLPFQRLGDRDNHTGVGLGLALSRGLAEAMAGTLTLDETPGGGLTMILTLPAGKPA